MGKATTLICTALLAATLAVPVHGWGRDGHQIAGAIAWHFLTDKAKASVTALLGNDDLSGASCWADEVRNQGGYEFSKPLHYINLPRSANAVDNLSSRGNWFKSCHLDFSRVMTHRVTADAHTGLPRKRSPLRRESGQPQRPSSVDNPYVVQVLRGAESVLLVDSISAIPR